MDTQQIRAPQADLIRATQMVLAEHGWTPTEAGAFAGRIVVKGTPRRAAIINARLPDDRTYVADSGCRVDIFPRPHAQGGTAHLLRVTCHAPRAVAPSGTAYALPQRHEWQDRYLAAHIIARLDPRQGQRVWQLEPTGQRSLACAQHALRGAVMPGVCVGQAPRPVMPRAQRHAL